MEISTNQAIADVLQSKSDATKNQIAVAVASKQIDAQKSLGKALVGLIETAATAQKQIAAGHLDVRV